MCKRWLRRWNGPAVVENGSVLRSWVKSQIRITTCVRLCRGIRTECVYTPSPTTTCVWADWLLNMFPLNQLLRRFTWPMTTFLHFHILRKQKCVCALTAPLLWFSTEHFIVIVISKSTCAPLTHLFPVPRQKVHSLYSHWSLKSWQFPAKYGWYTSRVSKAPHLCQTVAKSKITWVKKQTFHWMSDHCINPHCKQPVSIDFCILRKM